QKYNYYYIAFFVLFMLNLLFTFSGRAIILSNAKTHIKKGIVRFNALMVGPAENVMRIYKENENKLLNEEFDIKGYVRLYVSDKALRLKLPAIGSLNTLEAELETHKIKLVIIALDKEDQKLQEMLV